jgi:hypothetical protein
MNAGEYGLVINLDAQYDLSANTSLSMSFTRADSTTFTVTNPQVTIGAVPLSTALGTFAANQYAKYTLANGDLTVPGMYSVRLIYADATKKLYSLPVRFQVLP